MTQNISDQSFFKNSLFEAFTSSQLSQIQHLFEPMTFTKHQIIHTQGEMCELVYFIAKGHVRISKVTSEGRSFIISILGVGDIIGHLTLTENQYDFQSETIDECLIYAISQEALMKLIQNNAQFGIALMQMESIRLKIANERIEDLIFSPVPSRIAKLIINLADNYGKVTPNGIKIELPLTHQDIAELVGASRVTATQIINRLKTENCINITSKCISITNYEYLESIIHDPNLAIY